MKKRSFDHPSHFELVLLCSGVAAFLTSIEDGFIFGHFLVDKISYARVAVPLFTVGLAVLGLAIILVALERMRARLLDHDTKQLASLIDDMEAIEIDLPVGGPVRVRRWEKELFHVERGNSQTGVLDRPGYPLDSMGLPGTLLPLAEAMALTTRVVEHMKTSPTVNEVGAWLLAQTQAAANEPSLTGDEQVLCGFAGHLSFLLEHGGKSIVPPDYTQRQHAAALAYIRMGDDLREKVPPRFLLPMMDVLDTLDAPCHERFDGAAA